MRCHLTLVKMGIIKKATNNKSCRDVKKKESSYSVGGKVNWCSHCRRQ